MSILIAEDNVAQRAYLREILERDFPSHQPVIEAGDGEETVKLAKMLLAKNPQVYKSVKEVMHHVRGMDVEQATDYLKAKEMEMRFLDREQGRTQGMKQFLDDKAYRPGLETYKRG